ncbi:MAG: alpha/beta hydrolase [Xanthomonadales bacterium]|nr:alpha/beta hydrolase [Xanthomonadales bacterium]
MPLDPHSGVYFELHGQGQPLLLGFPVMASHGEIFGPEAARVRDRYLELLTDRYQVLLVDYPSIGRSRDIPPDQLTADRVCSDLLAVADAAGFERFTYWGYSWGASSGLQLAWRSDRIAALVAGGWPPLGAAYREALAASLEQIDNPPDYAMVVLRSPAQYAQWSTFLSSIQDWPEETAARRLACPRLAFVGAEGDTDAGSQDILNATILRQRAPELEAMGWAVRLIADEGHDVCMKPDVLVPVVREFLDPAMLSDASS